MWGLELVGQARDGINRRVDRIVGLDQVVADVASRARRAGTLGLTLRKAGTMLHGFLLGGEPATGRIVGVALDRAVGVEIALTDVTNSERLRYRSRHSDERKPELSSRRDLGLSSRSIIEDLSLANVGGETGAVEVFGDAGLFDDDFGHDVIFLSINLM